MKQADMDVASYTAFRIISIICAIKSILIHLY